MREGDIVDVTVHRTGTPRFSTGIMEIDESRSMKASIFEGNVKGTFEWTLDPFGGDIRITMHLKASPNRLLVKIIHRSGKGTLRGR